MFDDESESDLRRERSGGRRVVGDDGGGVVDVVLVPVPSIGVTPRTVEVLPVVSLGLGRRFLNDL